MANQKKLPINGDADKPDFLTQLGVTLQLKKVSQMLVAIWDEDYRLRNPSPIPPSITLENGDQYRNTQDEWYKLEYARWANRYNVASTAMMITAGVHSEPPDDFQTNFTLHSRKFVWLTTEVLTSAEFDLLVEAITSIDAPTAEAVDQAEKN